MTNPNPIATAALTADRLADFTEMFTWVVTPSQPTDLLTGAVARFYLYSTPGIALTMGAGVSVASNVITVGIPKATLATINRGNYDYDLFVDFLSGVTARFFTGGFTLL